LESDFDQEMTMDTLFTTIQQIKDAGLSPIVQVNVNLSAAELDRLQEIKTRLAQIGITPQVNLVIGVAGQPSAPGEDQPPVEPGDQEPVEKEGFLVMVRSAKVNCMNFTRRDKAGKPIMEPVMPRVQLFQSNTLRVSAKHKVSDKDPGDGNITATGGLKFYFITDSPQNRAAEGLYIRQEEVTKTQ
jgi:hypothetical protein